jgi:sugar phosphate isomerase/epimerase
MTGSLSLSTMAARGHYEDLRDFSRDAHRWGYTAVEANAFVTSSDMLQRLSLGPLPISSLHNPIPNVRSSLGMASYDLNLCSLDDEELREAVRFAVLTIEQAARFGARAIVLHMGHVPIGKEMQRALHDLWHEGRTESAEYVDIQRRIPEMRARTAALHVERALQTIRKLEPVARDRGVRLGVETRHNLHEIPNVDEMKTLLDEADPEVVGYWHDTGHAATHERLGFTTHEEWLRRHGSRMIGIHLHDINSDRDHQCPGSGHLDWKLVQEHVPAHAIHVCEIGEWNGPECLKTCPGFLERAGLFSPNGADGTI